MIALLADVAAQPDAAKTLIDQAAAAGDIIALSVGLVALAVVTVLKALGKQIPLVDSLIDVALGLFNKLRGVKPKAPPADPAAQPGLESVVKVEEKKP